MYAYFIDISQGSVEMHLWCGGIYNNHIITNCLQSVQVEEGKWDVFLAHSVAAESYGQSDAGRV